MLEMKITIAAPDLAAAINNLAVAFANGNTAPVEKATTPVASAPVAQAPIAQAPAASAVPTGAPTYTLEMIARAGTALVDAGKMDALCGLLAKYGVEALTALDPAQYGNFANDLRALGAQI